MSRIQDILAKADRDGTAGRTLTQPVRLTAPPVPAFDGTAALGPAYRPAAIDSVEPRVGQATLHPRLISAISPHSPAAEQYRAIRTRISQRHDTAPLRTILVTSPGEGDGKSITAVNLALTMAQEFQRRVVLVDANLRHPAGHELLGLERSPGLADVLADRASLDEALVALTDYGLTVLPAGEPPAFPAELLGSAAMRQTLDALSTRFDRVVIDAPAAAPLADAGTVAPLADGVLMVVRAGRTLRPALDDALLAFDAPRIVGIVLNDVR